MSILNGFGKSYEGITSGSFAAAGSVFGKLCGIPYFEGNVFLKALTFGLMIICNTCALTFFVKALQSCQSSLSATLISTSTNYVVTAVVGFLIFNEISTTIWWFGATLVVIGLILIIQSEQNSDSKLK